MKRFFTCLLFAVLSAFFIMSGCTATENKVPAETVPEATQGSLPEESAALITITVHGETFLATLESTAAAGEFVKRLPLTLDMNELNGNEKYSYIDQPLPETSSIPSLIRAGDLMLYGDNCLVLFYDRFKTEYSYTPIAHMEQADALADALGEGNVSVTFAMKPA